MTEPIPHVNSGESMCVIMKCNSVLPGIGVARVAGGPGPLIEMLPMIKMSQKNIVSSVSCSIFAYNSTRVRQ